MNNLMKFKEHSFYIYVCSILIVLFNLFVFPDLFNKDFNFNDTHDSGHSKYIESILSNKHNISMISGLPIVNESNLTNIINLKEISSNIHITKMSQEIIVNPFTSIINVFI
jgi:hypothetical protein